MSQKLSRTINLPKAPSSFTDEQKRYFDDIARSLTEQFRDMFDLLGEDAGSLEKHMGDVTAHKMSEGNVAGVGVIRSAEGKVRFSSADGTEATDDFGVTMGVVSPAIEHIANQEPGVHGSTATPTGGKIPVYSSSGRLKGAAPTDDNDLVPKLYFENNTQRSVSPASGKLAVFNANNRLQSSYPVSGEDVATYEFVVNAIDSSLERLICRGRGYAATAADTAISFTEVEDESGVKSGATITLNAGVYLVMVRVYESGYTSIADASTGTEYLGGYGSSMVGLLRLSESRPLVVKHSVPLSLKPSYSGYGIDIIAM